MLTLYMLRVYGSPKAEYFANAIDPNLGIGNGSFGNSIGVWALTNRDKISTGVLPTLSSTVVNTETFITPVPAQTPVGYNTGVGEPTAGLLNADDDALQNLQYINGHLYAASDTAVNVAGDTATTLLDNSMLPVKASGLLPSILQEQVISSPTGATTSLKFLHKLA